MIVDSQWENGNCFNLIQWLQTQFDCNKDAVKVNALYSTCIKPWFLHVRKRDSDIEKFINENQNDMKYCDNGTYKNLSNEGFMGVM